MEPSTGPSSGGGSELRSNLAGSPCRLLSQSQPSCNKRSCPSIPTLAKEGGRKMMRTTGPARVRAPWNAKAGKAARRTGAVLFVFRPSSAPARRVHPLVLGKGKRQALPRPHQDRERHGVGYAFFISDNGGLDAARRTKRRPSP